ncbi:MAG: TraR/DksA C4-type zinc finger protein [Deltaproteobacteria bacterium]|nr:TraR/DksA C4-type zinc finger protein [Deltaproteobacteria bacterium]
MLTEKKKIYFKKLLTDLLNEIRQKNSGESDTRFVDQAEQNTDFTDQATQESDMDYNIHMKERDSKLIIKIEEALDRIQDGTYGICEECNGEISEERLKARPVTTFCINCKKRQETNEKLRGL